MFDDEKKRWALVRDNWDTLSCEEKRKMSSYFIEVDLASQLSRFEFSATITEHLRPRFWYMTIVACNVPPLAKLRYRLHATNDLWGWQREFSFHRIGLLPFLAVATAAFALVTVATVLAIGKQSISHGQRWDKHP